MKLVYRENNRFLLRFDKGEEVLSLLVEFAEKHDIKSGVFSGIRSTDEILISWYNLEEKKYHDHALRKKLEVVSLNGNLSVADGQIVVHAHGCFSDVELISRSGHVKKLVVSSTCEIFLEAFTSKVVRKYSSDAGLSLFE